jgi:uncharacterized membrane protein YfcA
MPGTTFHRREQLMTTIQIEITVFTILFMAAFVQSISGFGSALMAMAFLPVLIGIRAAVPLFAICAIPLEIILLIRFRQELSLREIWKVVLDSIVVVPFGVILLILVSERIALAILGLALFGYSIYALLGKRLP